jgi:GTP-binding protein Era
MSDVTEEAAESGPHRAGFAAIIGAPNAGKSTLVNRLVGAKVSIVTQKVQTTRFPVRGVAIEGSAQIVLVDTPGIFKPRRRLDRAMVRSAWSGAEEAEAVVHLVDVQAQMAVRGEGGAPADRKAVEDVDSIVAGLNGAGRKAILGAEQDRRHQTRQHAGGGGRLFKTDAYSEVFMVSAANGSGVDDLKRRLAELMPEGHWLYPADQTGGPARAPSGRRDHPREGLPAGPRGAALFGRGRDHPVRGAEGRRRAHRADRLCGARKPTADIWQGRADPEVDREKSRTD